MTIQPSLDAQSKYWTKWLLDNKDRDFTDEFRLRTIKEVTECVTRVKAESALEVGCGTGWLCRELKKRVESVTGVDLSPEAIEFAESQDNSSSYLSGDFNKMINIPKVDFLVSCDIIAHVDDQRRFIDQCRNFTRLGGTFLLITQNPKVWSRTKYINPQGPGQIRRWPTLDELSLWLLHSGFEMQKVSTFIPHGDTGMLAWRPYANGILRRIIGRSATTALFEKLGLGRSLVIESIAV